MASLPTATVDEVSGVINEDEGIRARGLEEFRAAIDAAKASDPKFPALVRTDDLFLLAFLRARKYEVARALVCLKSFCSFWHDNPTLINGLCAASIKRVYNLGFMTVLDGKDIYGNNVSLMDIEKVDYSQFTDFEMVQMSLYISLCTLFGDEEVQKHGLTIVESFAGFSMWRMSMVTKKMREPGQAKVLAFGMDTIPMRIRALYVYKQPMWFSAFWSVVKWFFKKKLRDRLVLLGSNLEALHKVVPPSTLTPMFGGSMMEPQGAWLERREAQEREGGGMIGGFMFPLRADDPTGERRRSGETLTATTVSSDASPVLPPVTASTPVEAEAAATVNLGGGGEGEGAGSGVFVIGAEEGDSNAPKVEI